MTRRLLAVLMMALVALLPLLLRAAEQARPEARGAPVGVGDVAPDFTLSDANGQPQTLSAELDRQRAVVLVFYRGHW